MRRLWKQIERFDSDQRETIPRKILRDDAWAQARAVLARQCGQAMANIHKIDTSELKGLSHLSPATQVENYFTIYDDFGDPHPVFELAFKWLNVNIRRAVIHRTLHNLVDQANYRRLAGHVT